MRKLGPFRLRLLRPVGKRYLTDAELEPYFELLDAMERDQEGTNVYVKNLDWRPPA